MIMVESPNFSEVKLQSDDANCYQRMIIILAMNYLNLKCLGKTFTSEVAHAWAQYGKSELDTHFDKSKRFLIQFMLVFYEEGNMVKKICTSNSLVLSLSCKGGMKNSIAQLASFERENALDQISKFLEAKVMKKLGVFFSRINHAYFENLLSNKD